MREETEKEFWARKNREAAEGHIANLQPPSYSELGLTPKPKAAKPSRGQAPKKGLSRTAIVAASALTVLALVVGVLSFGNSPIPTSNGGNASASAGQTAAPDSPTAPQSPAPADDGKAKLASVDSCNPVTLDPNNNMNLVSTGITSLDDKFKGLIKDPRGLPLVEAQLQEPDATGKPMVSDLPKIPDVQSLFTQQGDRQCLSPLAVQVYNTAYSYFLGDNPAVVNRTITIDPIPADYSNTGIDPATGEPVRSDKPATCDKRAIHASIQLAGFSTPLNTYDCQNCSNPQLRVPPAAIRVVEVIPETIVEVAPPPVVIVPPVVQPPPVVVVPPVIVPPVGPPPCWQCGPPPCRFRCGPPPCREHCGPPPCRDHCGPPPCREHCGPPPCPNGLCPKPPWQTPTGPNMPGQSGHVNNPNNGATDVLGPPARPKPTSPAPRVNPVPPPAQVAPEIQQAPRQVPIQAPVTGANGGGGSNCPPVIGCATPGSLPSGGFGRGR